MLKANATFLKYLEARDKRSEDAMETLRHENRDLYIRSHLPSTSHSALIFKQADYMREKNERGRIESNFNLRGAVGMLHHFIFNCWAMLIYRYRKNRRASSAPEKDQGEWGNPGTTGQNLQTGRISPHSTGRTQGSWTKRD